MNTDRTASARSAKRRSQPRTVSAGRRQIRRDPAKPEPGIVAFAASADTITAAVSARRSNARHRQQHMRHPAPGAPRPARTQLHRPVRAAQLPRPGPSPARQHTAARRAPQLTRRQPALDSIDICLYGDHCASKREQTALPQHSGQRDNGRAVAYQ